MLPLELPANPFDPTAAQSPGATAGVTGSTSPAATAKPPTAKKSGSFPPGAVLVFDNSRRQVELVVPGPQQWTLFVNEPDVQGTPIVGRATGTSGTLVVPYPTNFCGVIQADVLVGAKRRGPGLRATVATCTSPPIPVTPQQGGGTATPPPASPTGTTTSNGGSPSPEGSSQPTLPFTGVGKGLQGSAIGGSGALLLGLALLLLSSPRHPRLALARRRVTRTFLWLVGDYEQ